MATKLTWDPKWSDESESNDGDDLFTAIEVKKSQLKSNDKTCTERDKINSNNSSSERGTQPTQRTCDNLEDSLFKRKFYSKEELFKNLASSKIKAESSNVPAKTEDNGKNNRSFETESLISKRDLDNKTEGKGTSSCQIKCEDCGKTFPKRIHLTLHQKIHNRMDKCHVQKGKDSKRELSDDSMLVSMNKLTTSSHPEELISQLICDKCGRRFERSNQLKFHKKLCKVITNDKIKSFEKDGPVREKNEADNGSLDNVSSSIKNYRCVDCGKQFKFLALLNFHKRLHLKICEKCLCTFHERELDDHIHSCSIVVDSHNHNQSNLIASTLASASKIACHTCGKSFSSQTSLTDHQNVHQLGIESFEVFENEDFEQAIPFGCKHPGCCSRFSDETDLTLHLEQKHNNQSLSGPKFYRISDNQVPPINPYVMLSKNIKQSADLILFQTTEKKPATAPLAISNKLALVGNLQTDLSYPSPFESYCSICERMFLDQTSFQAHLKIHASDPSFKSVTRRRYRHDIPEQRVYTCDKCQKVFTKRNYYLIHLANHRREERLTCSLCNRRFSKQTALDLHLERHADPEYDPYANSGRRGRIRTDIPFQNVYTCETCGQKFKKRNLFLMHLREERLKCQICERKFPSQATLDAHVERHSDPSYNPSTGGRPFRHDIPVQDIYTCEECGDKFDKRNQFLLHLREEKFKCKLCDRKFQSESLLQAHIKLHSDPSYVPEIRGRQRLDIPVQSVYRCEICQKKFTKRNYYLIHLSNHKREERFTCSLCNRKYGSQALLDAHVKRHSDPSYVPGSRGRQRRDVPIQSVYTCEICQKKFTKRNYYLIHVSYHKREERFTCSLCNRKYGSQALLDAHVERHSDPSYVPGSRGRQRWDVPFQDEYTCQTCGEKFSNRNLFLIHLREERFKCQICERKFPSQSMLDAHVKRHSDPSFNPSGRRFRHDIPIQSVYSCSTCQKEFQSRHRFLIHLSMHKMENKYKCLICQKKCQSAILLQSHMRKHSEHGRQAGRPKGADIPIQDFYSCEHCQKSFTDRIKFIVHLRSHSEKLHKCDRCLKLYKTAQVRDLHKEKFCKGIPCKYKCDRCNDRFHNRITLARHFHRFHSKVLENKTVEVEYPCSQCSQTFNTTFGLTRHYQVYHPATSVTLESNAVEPANEFKFENKCPSNSWDPEDDNMLAVSFCEAELDETLTEENRSEIASLKRKGIICSCGKKKLKYKTQKQCHNSRCPCVQAGNKCSSKCDCVDSGCCMNNAELEFEQRKKFEEGKESMVVTESCEPEDADEDNYSTPIIIGYSGNLMEGSIPAVEPEPTPHALTFSIPSSEFISLDSVQDESMRQLSLEGYVEGAEDMDPLSDPLSATEVQVESSEQFTIPQASASCQSVQLSIHFPGTNSLSNNSVPIISSTTSLASNETINTSANRRVGVKPGADLKECDITANLRCQFCKKNFKVIPSYISHILMHAVEKDVLKCPICLVEFGNQVVAYAQHLEMHNKGINIQCSKCHSKFKTYKDMKLHSQVHHFKPMECGYCQLKFSNPQLMMSHWSKQHPTCQCGLCNVKFFSYDDLTFHMKSLHSPYDCNRCSERFDKLDGLLGHFLQKHTTQAQQTPNLSTGTSIKFKCSQCTQSFSSCEDLTDHILSDHITDNASYAAKHYQANYHQCEQCKATFTTVEDLHEHLAQHIMGSGNVSSSGKEYVHFSNSGFTSQETRQEPINDNTQASEVLCCPKCVKTFPKRSGLKKHLRTHDVSLCSNCDSIFDTKEELVQHLQINSCVVFFCEICSSNFQSKTLLSQHKRVHDRDQRRLSSTQTNTQENEALYGSEENIPAETSFPVIVASTSLASNNAAQPITYIRFNPPNRQSHGGTQQQEIEEIVID